MFALISFSLQHPHSFLSLELTLKTYTFSQLFQNAHTLIEQKYETVH